MKQKTVKEDFAGQTLEYRGENYELALAGSYQTENAALALEALEVLGRVGYPTTVEQRMQVCLCQICTVFTAHSLYYSHSLRLLADRYNTASRVDDSCLLFCNFNIIRNTVLAVLVPISMDHQAFLGNTLSESEGSFFRLCGKNYHTLNCFSGINFQ